MWGQLSTTCSNLLKQPNGELLVAVNHNWLRTMASETVDLIIWSHPPPSWTVPPERLVHSINQCNLSGNRTCNGSMRGNHLAYAATQGLLQFFPFSFFLSIGWYCGAGVFGLIGCISLSLSLALPTIFNYKKKSFHNTGSNVDKKNDIPTTKINKILTTLRS